MQYTYNIHTIYIQYSYIIIIICQAQSYFIHYAFSITLATFMSLQRYKKRHSQNSNMLKNKLETVDSYIRRSENLPHTIFMHPQLLQHLRREKVQIQVNNQIMYKVPRLFLFDSTPVAKFYFNYLPISHDKRYCLKIQPTKTQLEVFVQIDSQKKHHYIVNVPKGILIEQQNWQKVQFTLSAKIQQRSSLAKVQMSTITIQHKVKVHGIPSKRKAAQEHMKQFLKNNLTKQKIDQILQLKRKRSQSQILSRKSLRAKTSSSNSSLRRNSHQQLNMHLYRTMSGFNQSTGFSKNPFPAQKQSRIQSTQLARDLKDFENVKQKYIRHIQKMCPNKGKAIFQNKQQYDEQKFLAVQQFSCLIKLISFINNVYKLQIKLSKQKIRHVRRQLIMKKFVRQLSHVIKTRMPMKIKNKLTADTTINMISCCLWNQSKRKAQQRIMNCIKNELFKIDIEKASNLSIRFIEICKKLQRKYRLNNEIFKIRFLFLLTKVKKYEIENSKQIEKLYRKYKADCYKKSKNLKYFFTKNHRFIDQLMKQKQQQKYKF